MARDQARELKNALLNTLGADLERCKAADKKTNVVLIIELPAKQCHLEQYFEFLAACIRVCPNRVLHLYEIINAFQSVDAKYDYMLSKANNKKMRNEWAQAEAA
jgi:hypothetical protein